MEYRDPALQELLDHHAIRKTLIAYCNSLDRADELRLADTYTAGSLDDHGIFTGSGSEFAHFITTGMARHGGSSHMLGQSMITASGETAGAETYFLAVIRQPAVGEPPLDMIHQLGGRYIDRLVREVDGEWRIQKRVVVRDWSISLPVELDLSAGAGMKLGRMNKHDPCFEVLAIDHSGVPDIP
jgi:hypothetical protein